MTGSPAAPATILFENVGFHYRGGPDVLRSISVQIPNGAFTVLLGPSGAGKSSLLRLINGLAHPTSGRIAINGRDLTRSARRELGKRIAAIYQDFALVGRASVAQNVMSGALPVLPLWRVLSGVYPSELKRRVCQLVEAAGLDASLLARRTEQLSGGQQQRVGVARAFILRPMLLLADEPVASLDPRIARDILALIRAEARASGATVVCSLHQLDLAREFADHIIALRAGEIAYAGPAEQFWRRPQDVQELYGTAA